MWDLQLSPVLTVLAMIVTVSIAYPVVSWITLSGLLRYARFLDRRMARNHRYTPTNPLPEGALHGIPLIPDAQTL